MHVSQQLAERGESRLHTREHRGIAHTSNGASRWNRVESAVASTHTSFLWERAAFPSASAVMSTDSEVQDQKLDNQHYG